MSVYLFLLILSEVLLPNLTCASRVRRETTKVRISAIGDTITLKFLQPDMDTKLEGYILGYGRDLFSKQFMPLPEDGEPYETEIDAEPKYLVAVQPVKGDKVKKECAGNQSLKKPLHLVIGSVTPTSVMLSWGTLLNTLSTETNLDDCIDDGHYTVRYREKEPRKKWSYQTCPTTVTVIDQLKPETPYEFGVRAVSENGVWSPPITHNTADRDINKPVVPENILKSMKPITESPQASSPSVPGVSSVAPVSSASFLQAKDMAIHKPVKPKKFPRPMKLNTESPQASSPSLPVLYTVTQSRPAYLHGPPAPPPIPRVTQDIHKPLKPEIFIKAEAPSTESPQDFSPSVPLLPIVMQTQSPASTPTHQSPTSTQRVNEDTHKPPTSENILMPDKPITESPQAFSPSVPIVHNVTHSRPASVLRHTAPPPIPRPMQPVQTPSEKPNTHYLPWREEKPVTKISPVSKKAPSQSLDGHLTKPVLVSGATDRNQGQDTSSTSDFLAHTSAPTVTKRFSTVSLPNPIRMPPTNSSAKTQAYYGKYWDKSHKGPKKPELNEIEKQTNQVDKDESDDKVIDLKVVGAVPDMKPSPAPPIMDQKTPTTTPFFANNGSRYNIGDNSSIFSSVPVSEVDPMGKKRFIAPHVVYQIDKPPKKPCSVTNALSHFPEEENEVTSISGPPKTAPTNLTVVTVEGCPSFVIIDWDGTDNETTAYEVTSSVKSPNGQVVSVVTTNQTHTAVENLKPESSYEFTVTPKNELGSGPSSEPVSFNTESADPRVSKVPTGKNAIWSSFSFKADGYSECTGTQYVKRTWYRKFVGIQLCNSLRYKIYLSDSLKGKFYNIGDETGYGEDHCQFVDSFLDGRTGLLPPHQLPLKQGFFRAMRQEPVRFGKIGGSTQINYVAWYECGVPIPGSW
ncbi:hypothetical protein HF521_016116 [Silurus meridionalis]|uniref:Fibronectin type-III domain-containing protein n=1 Tax=Silurus meridionalis TaxID=175797 RepID=A0A8T0BUX7_SILME|nr:hypothetical protein HF521_016116 [Silurus meridionalis]